MIMLIILMFFTLIFIPVYYVFYKLTNYSDEYPWAKKMMKGWLVVASVLGIVFTVFSLIFLSFNMIVSGFCFYSNEILVNKDFYKTYKADLNFTDEKIISIIQNCFDKTTANFSYYFNQNGAINTSNNQTTQEDIRTKPKTTLVTDGRNLQDNSNSNTGAPISVPTTFNTSLLSDF